MPNMVKSRFASLLRRILRRMEPQAAPVAPTPRPVAPTPRPVAPTPRPVAAAAPGAFAARPAYAATPPPILVNPPPSANVIAIPLVPIIAGLPMELRAKIMAIPLAGLSINLPVETVTAQLAFGAVKISFGELRQLAPSVFANSGGEHDNKLVSLPLNEILPRLNPALLARRPTTKVEVAEDINGPFGGRGSGLAFTTQPLNAPTPAPSPAPAPVPVSAPMPAPFWMNPPEPVAAPPVPSTPIAFTPPSWERPATPAPSAQPIRPVTPPAAPPAPVLAKPVISAAPAPSAPRPEPAPPTIFAALWELAENWPEELKAEISQSALANVSVPLAGSLVEAGLKRGRVTMTWKQLRTLAKPSSPASSNDNVELDLPLKVIAPLFFSARKNLSQPQVQATVSSDIPDLFHGFPPAAPEPPKAEEKPVSPPSFTHCQTPPKDVVGRAAQLPGVVGAVVTLPDGLHVASEVPAGFNADMLAAFIPQVFERMNQSAKVLRMGALNNVSFTVGNVPWRLYHVNSVYFAAFGRAGETLPAAPLAALAGELDQKRTQ
jgi:predicted regulator of Ras-like GTPase activity (Roadblock/LC7/MglB family)